MTETQHRPASVRASLLTNTSARLLTPQSNFFDEGGRSVLAQQMFFRIKKEWAEDDIPIKVIFQPQALEGLAAEIDRVQDPMDLRLDALPLAADEDVEDEAYAADAKNFTTNSPSPF